MVFQKNHILIVEDEAVSRATLAAYLEREGYRVTQADSGHAMREALTQHPDIELLLLDINLPDSDGLSLMRELRQESDIAIVLVTAKSDDIDRIIGLELGADDYICKPYLERELLARIKTILRRAQRSQDADVNLLHRFEGWQLDSMKRVLTNQAGEEVSLTTAEFDLLMTFIQNSGRVLNRNQLLESISKREWNPNDRTVDVMVGRLRRKIEQDPSSPRIFITVRSIGYQFAAHVQ